MISTAISTNAIIKANGAAPAKISPSVIDGSSSADFMTNTEMPNGGVSRPISTANTVTMPNQIRSTCIDETTGSISGTKMSMIDEESRMVPMTITSAT